MTKRAIRTLLAVGLLGSLLATFKLAAIETENHTLPVLPTPGKIVVDGKTDDWDLSGGVFARRVRSAIDGLTTPQRVVVELVYQHGLKYRVAARRIGIPVESRRGCRNRGSRCLAVLVSGGRDLETRKH